MACFSYRRNNCTDAHIHCVKQHSIFQESTHPPLDPTAVGYLQNVVQWEMSYDGYLLHFRDKITRQMNFCILSNMCLLKICFNSKLLY